MDVMAPGRYSVVMGGGRYVTWGGGKGYVIDIGAMNAIGKMSRAIIMVVLGSYITWGGVVSADFIACRSQQGWGKDICGPQESELKSVFSTITVGLMGWLSDKPGD